MCICYHGGGCTSPINNSSCMLNFMCTALENCFLLSKIRFRKRLRNQELYLLGPYVNKELEIWGSWQLLRTSTEISGYSQAEFDENISEIKVLLPTKAERVKTLQVLLLPNKRNTSFTKTSHCEICKGGPANMLISKMNYFTVPFTILWHWKYDWLR